MTLGRVATLVGIALAVIAINIAISVLYMVVYGYVIDPGHEQAHYQAHAQVAAPYCSIIAGIPLMFLAGRWMGGSWGANLALQSTLIVGGTYAVVDVMALAAYGVTARAVILVTVSVLTKLAAFYGGAVGAASR